MGTKWFCNRDWFCLLVSSAPISSSHPVPACWEQGHDCGSHLPHPASPILSWDDPQHNDMGPPGATKHPQTLEPELPATRAAVTALCCTLLQRGEGLFILFFLLFIYIIALCVLLYNFGEKMYCFASRLQDLSKSPKSVKKLLPKRKPERKQSEEEFALRKSMCSIFKHCFIVVLDLYS